MKEINGLKKSRIHNHEHTIISLSNLQLVFYPREERKGDAGVAYWQTRMLNDIRVRLVEYSPGYKADHWCKKGHALFCMEGEMQTELEDGRIMKLTKGMCYFVGDNNEAHRSSTLTGCKLFIVD